MINLFKKKNNQPNILIELIANIINMLPLQFEYLRNQISGGIIKGIKSEKGPFQNYSKISLDVKALNKFEKPDGKYFAIKGIKVFDIKHQKTTEIHLYIGYGLLIGFSTPEIKELAPDISTVDISGYYLEFFVNDDFEAIKAILTNEEVEVLNSNNVYEVELEGKVYYHIKDLEDGDFIGIDKEKNLYKITHDPYEIVSLKESILQIFRD